MSDNFDVESPKKKLKTGFRLQGNHLFLTYSKCLLSKEESLEQLSKKLDIINYIIAEEKHKDNEEKHIHCYLKLKKRCNITNQNKLDMNKEKLIFHGNYVSCKNYNAVKYYCKKEENYITNIEDFKPIAPAILAIEAAREGNIKEARNIIINDPNLARDYLKSSSNIENTLIKLNEKPIIKKKIHYVFKEVKGISNWNRKKYVLWLRGPSGYGKTEFAKSLFTNPLLVRHRNKLKEFRHEFHDGIIFDDYSLQKYEREIQIHYLDVENDTQIDIKFDAINIPEGTPRVFTSNFSNIFNLKDKSIRRRIRLIKIKEDIRILKEKSNNGEDSRNSMEPSSNEE